MVGREVGFCLSGSKIARIAAESLGARVLRKVLYSFFEGIERRWNVNETQLVRNDSERGYKRGQATRE